MLTNDLTTTKDLKGNPNNSEPLSKSLVTPLVAKGFQNRRVIVIYYTLSFCLLLTVHRIDVLVNTLLREGWRS